MRYCYTIARGKRLLAGIFKSSPNFSVAQQTELKRNFLSIRTKKPVRIWRCQQREAGNYKSRGKGNGPVMTCEFWFQHLKKRFFGGFYRLEIDFAFHTQPLFTLMGANPMPGICRTMPAWSERTGLRNSRFAFASKKTGILPAGLLSSVMLTPDPLRARRMMVN